MPKDGDKEHRREKEEAMSEERAQHPQEPAEGSDEDVETPGVERASGPRGGGDEESGPAQHTQEPAEGSDEDVDAPGAERAGDGG
jgi:hypothetical protein